MYLLQNRDKSTVVVYQADHGYLEKMLFRFE